MRRSPSGGLGRLIPLPGGTLPRLKGFPWHAAAASRPGMALHWPWQVHLPRSHPRKTHQRRPLSQRGTLCANGSAAGAVPLLMRAARRRGMLGAMDNPYGINLDEASLRWAAAEGVSKSVIAAICLLDEKSVDEIVAKLSPVELEQVIKIVGRSPRGYPPGAYDALKEHRRTPSPEHAANVWPLPTAPRSP